MGGGSGYLILMAGNTFQAEESMQLRGTAGLMETT